VGGHESVLIKTKKERFFMGNLFKRLKDSLAADVHDLLDQKEQKNPMASLNHYLRQSEQEKEKVRKLLERQYRLKDEFTREFHRADELAQKRQKQAEIAEKAGEAELHAFAVQEYEEYRSRADRLKQSRQDAVDQLSRLEEKYEQMKHKLKDMHLRRMELMGRENIARANHQIDRVIDEASDKPFSRFAEIESFIEGLEYKIDHAYKRSTFDQKISRLEKQLEQENSLS